MTDEPRKPLREIDRLKEKARRRLPESDARGNARNRILANLEEMEREIRDEKQYDTDYESRLEGIDETIDWEAAQVEEASEEERLVDGMSESSTKKSESSDDTGMRSMDQGLSDRESEDRSRGR